jgi:hypothetical protein
LLLPLVISRVLGPAGFRPRFARDRVTLLGAGFPDPPPVTEADPVPLRAALAALAARPGSIILLTGVGYQLTLPMNWRSSTGLVAEIRCSGYGSTLTTFRP